MGKHVGAVGTGTIGPLGVGPVGLLYIGVGPVGLLYIGVGPVGLLGVGPVGLLGFGPDGPVGFLFDGLDLVIDENKIILRQFRANLLCVVQNNWKRNTSSIQYIEVFTKFLGRGP